MVTNPSACWCSLIWLTSIAPLEHIISNSVDVVVSSQLSLLGRLPFGCIARAGALAPHTHDFLSASKRETLQPILSTRVDGARNTRIRFAARCGFQLDHIVKAPERQRGKCITIALNDASGTVDLVSGRVRPQPTS